MQQDVSSLLSLPTSMRSTLLTMLRSCTLRNSPTAVQNTILELHSENWLKRSTMYLQDCQRHELGVASLLGTEHIYAKIPDFATIPTAKWFLSVYARDVMSRMDSLKGNILSVFDEILKIDSTKKILKKLSGHSKDSASWVTNVGNEYGGILQCVVTYSESNDTLQNMADGLMERYRRGKLVFFY